ncbi:MULTISPECIES: ABC transporter ATP-binding protein/permease [Rhizobium/Agrobacterium group]|uniref:ABC transporter ATP-binding protein/permease n=2 Tax=Agrobacterium tumefaciens complex TaxID=1183400 RepID=A0AAE6BR13_AGRTU|nr:MULTISPECIES: ABC transporter ATP-binding protein/permease [Rhizobium/Agrobacterium group]KNY33525.1 ABC transporter ATP-binding protein [Agrobacterium sp. SUL3]KRA55506.1 ABC transporter ATP-binding protein [Rhizobium sp. Root651]MBP8938568.1 ABC transporter ATP-binding protein/permease [Agrobacterium sp.]MCA2373009.1 ABC transporter ATP-binding protein/permease [Agrobacterium tomkonis CIP 111-78]MCD4661108.1 ABC transporter ATP-binding protein/permease [Agrobacterium sp.]
MTDADANPKPVDGTGQNGAKNAPMTEDRDIDDPLPPEEIEPASGLTPEEAEQARKRYLLKRFWISARGYWSRRGDRLAWPFSLGLLAMIGINVGFQYGINVWNRGIFDAIEKRDASTVYFLGSVFPPLVLGSVLIVTSQVYARMLIQRRWRSWLTKLLVARWIANGRYYQLNLIDGDHQNPEARLSEDMRIATEAPVDFVAGVIAAFVSASTFIVVLWTIGGALTLSVAGVWITIPGFLVVAAVIYAVVTSSSIALIGRNFVRVSEVKNQLEAEFRYTLTRVRENGESIALLGGEEEERSDLDKRFVNVRRQWRLMALQYMRTTIVSHGSMLIAPVVPVLLCAPKFLDGSMSLGEVMQSASAFTIVQSAFGWLVDNYPRLADWNACARRVASLMMSLDGLERAEQSDTLGRIVRGETEGETMLSLKDVSVSLGDGTAVVKETDVEIGPGERVLVAGESGSGKSTLVRAIAGLWPWGGGDVSFRAGSRLFMLPQRPYIPSGTLRRAVCYPQAAESWTLEEIGAALDKVGLGHLKDKVEEEAPWDQTLSGGEKQRLTFARLLLNDPDIIVMDEATAALDEKSQDKMMQTVIDELPDATIVSVAHRAELEAFHSRKITLERREGGAKLVSDIHLAPRKGRAGSLLRRMVKRK